MAIAFRSDHRVQRLVQRLLASGFIWFLFNVYTASQVSHASCAPVANSRRNATTANTSTSVAIVHRAADHLHEKPFAANFRTRRPTIRRFGSLLSRFDSTERAHLYPIALSTKRITPSILAIFVILIVPETDEIVLHEGAAIAFTMLTWTVWKYSPILHCVCTS